MTDEGPPAEWLRAVLPTSVPAAVSVVLLADPGGRARPLSVATSSRHACSGAASTRPAASTLRTLSPPDDPPTTGTT
ncbi:hypothetical protein GB931_07440 [Modestobacter sp. I12A-02628]|uniref:Uncharacterized protein n=1 Tax=Goekera deserti TaxID=2497753 RepID=A0A7K3WI24_9ACTN|nr:hypothetical protein [Goekera deserti]MPQ97756.1 hypothetical protein [Goekera deserti]NDI48401.1 hypothetical protein [Goekera deserti]NEL56002.1 hypothetical protein [Goekera deserti]